MSDLMDAWRAATGVPNWSDDGEDTLRAFLGECVRRGLVREVPADPWTLAAEAAAEALGTRAEDVLDGRRTGDAAEARHVAYWLLRDGGRSYPEVGRLADRDHTTVMHGCKRVEADPRLLAVAERLREELP